MFVNKIGKDHLDIGKNNQDFGLNAGHVKLVCDGCSEGSHSEVGAKMFTFAVSDLLEKISLPRDILHRSFGKVIAFFGYEKIFSNPNVARDFLCFTIMSSFENATDFEVYLCGDGYIIFEDNAGEITFEEISNGEYPCYMVYNLMNSDKLLHYKNGVDFVHRKYEKTLYKNVGVASDGVRFILNSTDELKNEFISIIKERNENKLKRFINKHQSIFKDDITISF